MSSSKAIIACYLETISNLTGASSVNLCLTESGDINISPRVYQSDHLLLAEFDHQDPQQLISHLNQLQFENNQRETNAHSLLTITQGVTSKTRLIHFNMSLELGFNTSLAATNTHANRREADHLNTYFDYSLWLGLDFAETPPEWLQQDSLNSNLNAQSSKQALIKCLLQLGGLLTQHLENTTKLLSDPVTALSGRIEFQNNLALMTTKSPRIAMLLINPSEFQLVNKRFGHDAGDRVIGQTASILSTCLRKSDLISRFGGALFAIALPLKKPDDVLKIAENLRSKLQQPEYLDGAVSPDFNLGVAEIETNQSELSPTEQVNQLINKAEQALHAAKVETESNIVLWHPQQHQEHVHQQDHIGGIFTADTTTDYRNMLLLWDISNLTASFYQFEPLFEKFIQRISQTFDFISAGILPDKGSNQLNASLCFTLNEQGQISKQEKLITTLSSELCQSCFAEAKQDAVYKEVGDGFTLYCATLSETSDEVFFLLGYSKQFELASDSRLLLTALVKQLGRAHSRAQLEEQLNHQLYSQKEKLREELDELKQSLSDSEVHYCSASMEALMKMAQRTAQSNVTTLIVGESGTGKGRLVQAMHQMGGRTEHPLVIVDCGAIPENLIESELFGHVKGAFTGAHSNAKGKILEAEGGTLMLDEIGELPLNVQSKLLRFVQEKQFTPVGGTKTRDVDVKIIAATNRELQQEVEQGRFRQDLFYRLNVIALRTPPLRERVEDIPLLSKHFLKKFSLQHGEQLKILSSSAAQFMLSYSWPGNVRELENRLMQATLLSDGLEIQIADLNIEQAESYLQAAGLVPNSISKTKLPQAEKKLNHDNQDELQVENMLNDLRQILTQFISKILVESIPSNIPLGRWLEEDIISMAYIHCDKKSKLTALRLGLPHSTLRRKLSKIEEQASTHLATRAENWQSVMNCLLPFIEGQVFIGSDSIKQVKLILLSAILESSIDNIAIAAALLAVSEPTFYKLKKELLLTD
jgi:diguanylate cyclase (GGDEF)-like protein